MVQWEAGLTGVISASNSLVGSTVNDYVGSIVTALTNGNNVVSSPNWDNGAAADVGAVTWCSGTLGCTGIVSASNSLVGSTASDLVGGGPTNNSYSITALTNGNYVVGSWDWDNGAATNVGAISWCGGTQGCMGAVTNSNSVLGTAANGGVNLTFAFDIVNNQLVVGRPSDNRVTLFKTGVPELKIYNYLPFIRR